MDTPLLSVIIDNYNYARFLPDAIESALAQTYPSVEVVVVDDGSTDSSKTIIQAYTERVTSVFKPNGGQASALNVGFRASQGDIIIFLDADDTLLPDTATRVVASFQQHCTASKVMYRLEIMDEQGALLGSTTPDSTKELPQGNVTVQLLATPDDIVWPPTSGNAFRREVLGRILPIPEEDYPICADYYLSNLAALGGEVVALDGVGGQYRVHGANYHHSALISVARRRTILQLTERTHAHLRHAARAQGLEVPDTFHSLSFLAHRLLSLKASRALHPFPQESVTGIVRLAITQLWQQPAIPVQKKLMYGGWFCLTAFAPRFAVGTLDRLYFQNG